MTAENYRAIMEKKLGRRLTSQEQVHHINLDINDNRPENLAVFRDAEDHSRAHGSLSMVASKLIKMGVIVFGDVVPNRYHLNDEAMGVLFRYHKPQQAPQSGGLGGRSGVNEVNEVNYVRGIGGAGDGGYHHIIIAFS
jgi:hypothetical protein